MERRHAIMDGNEAAARIAHLANEVIAIYPITPASPMGELCDAWSVLGRKNIFGTVPRVVEMQSEGGAAGAVHGALQAGALTTTFTASQGLLLMIPDMFKIAGELTPAVFHVAARSVATHALSIFGDHSDVMAARSTGWAMLCAATVQEVHDFALIAQAATLESRVPFLHFFDGFRTSHEMAKIELLPEEVVRRLLPHRLVDAFRSRALTPDHPVLRGTAQNPDVFFQAREAINPFYRDLPGVVQRTMESFAELTGRRYSPFDYVGHPEAERVVVVMGSGSGSLEEASTALVSAGERVGVLKVRLFRPFDTSAFTNALPPTVKSVAVLDRTKEPGAVGEPLYQDVVTALAESWPRDAVRPEVVGGRYGLSSKEFTPAMALAIFQELATARPKNHFTIGITDDVTHTSLSWRVDDAPEPAHVSRAVLYGLGSDGTVGAAKNSVKIVGDGTPLHAQGYFVYDSKKAGSVTVSHLRFSPEPIRSSYLIRRADFVACHQFGFLDKIDVLETAAIEATFLLNSPHGPETVWEKLPWEVQNDIIAKKLRFFVVDADAVADEAGLGRRINTVMQACFFKLAGVLPVEEALSRIKDAIGKTYGKAGKSVLDRNFAAVDGALAALHAVRVPPQTGAVPRRRPVVGDDVPDFVAKVTAVMLAGKGDLLPVSAMPVDGTFPTGTARFEKRGIAATIPIWQPDLCIECGLCAFVCPHAAIRTKAYDPADLATAPGGFASRTATAKELAGLALTIQVAPEDCTGCGVCVDVCPARDKEVARRKSINMEPFESHVERERANFAFFLDLAEADADTRDTTKLRGSQLAEPLFEFSGACAGCGETPYLKLLTQLFGDRVLVANATGCSSIYGGNLPTTPWTKNADGRGPAWSNSLFEDNAEFGLGMRLAVDQQRALARALLELLAPRVGDELAREILSADQDSDALIASQRERVARLKATLEGLDGPEAPQLRSVADALVDKSVWIVGGDGWAYDIGFGGLDHVLASGADVNILVLDTEVYSNTGGQASKATPRGAVAKFAAGGKPGRKKDLGMIAVDYGDVYVAQIAIGAQPQQTLQAFHEARSYRGTSLLLAYSHCIAHGIDMSTSMTHQKKAVKSGYWPLFRYDPREAHAGGRPFRLDSRRPSVPFIDFAMEEGRFAMLARSDPERAKQLFALAQQDVEERWHFYEQMAEVERSAVPQAGDTR